jgi:acetyl esterase/lipase
MKKTSPLLLTALLCGPLLFTLRPQASTTDAQELSRGLQSDVSVDENVSHSSTDPVLRLDVYKPAGAATAPRPAVLLIHGGGWTSFDKSTMQGMGNFLARHGYVALSVDYRLFADGKNSWPAQLDNVQRAVRWTRANPSKYDVDPNHIGAFGHSAGAQLAALLGMEDTRDNSDPKLAKYSSRVQAVVDVSGPTDFPAMHDPERLAFLTQFLDADYAKNPQAWRNASPVSHVAKTDAPFLILHGTQDQSVSMDQPQELYEKLKAAGVQVSFIKVNDVHPRSPSPASHRDARVFQPQLDGREVAAPFPDG